MLLTLPLSLLVVSALRSDRASMTTGLARRNHGGLP